MAVMTAAAIAGTAINLATTAKSFAEANKQKRAAQEADRAATKALADARQKLSVNRMKDLSINKEAYEIEAEKILSSSDQIMTAAVEGGRGAASAAGRVAAANQTGQRQTASSMEDTLNNLDMITQREEIRLDSQRAGLDLAESRGAQIAAAEAENLRSDYITGALEGIGGVGTSLIEGQGLYNFEGMDPEMRAKNRAERKANKKVRDPKMSNADRNGMTDTGPIPGDPDNIGFSK